MMSKQCEVQYHKLQHIIRRAILLLAKTLSFLVQQKKLPLAREWGCCTPCYVCLHTQKRYFLLLRPSLLLELIWYYEGQGI